MRIWTPKTYLRLAALSGFVSVAVGAFAAHGVHEARPAELLKTGALYEMTHAVAVFAAFAVARATGRPNGLAGGLAAGLFLLGTLVFSGTLYAMAFGGPRILGAITPIGGVAFLAGWLVLAWSVGKVVDEA